MKISIIIIVLCLSVIGILNTLYLINIQPTELMEFNDVETLKVWLNNNDINNNTYINVTYDCDDFAIDLCNDAVQDGYIFYTSGGGIVHTETVTVYSEHNNTFYEGDILIQFYNHLYCITKINGIWYHIEPQNDKVFKIGTEL